MAAVQAAIDVVDDKYTWKTLVEFDNTGSFTLPNDATWALFIIFNADGKGQKGSAIHRVNSNFTAIIIPVNDGGRSIWSISNSGRTFTFTTGEEKKISVYYR